MLSAYKQRALFSFRRRRGHLLITTKKLRALSILVVCINCLTMRLYLHIWQLLIVQKQQLRNTHEENTIRRSEGIDERQKKTWNPIIFSSCFVSSQVLPAVGRSYSRSDCDVNGHWSIGGITWFYISSHASRSLKTVRYHMSWIDIRWIWGQRKLCI